MLEIASQITLCLLIAAFIGFIIGYSAGKWGAKKPTKQVKKADTPKTEEVKEDIEIPTKTLMANAVEAMEEMEQSDTLVEEKSELKTDEETKPLLLDAPRDEGKDALTKIKGIPPKVEEKLNEAGIYHFDQISSWTESNIQWLQTHTTFAHRAKKDLWVQQAKIFV